MKKITIASCIILLFSLLKIDKVEAQNSVRPGLTISGVVIDEEQLDPMVGVSVSIKRNGKTASGTITDLNGRYSLEVNSSDSLVFSFIGYVTQTYGVGNQRILDVQMSSVSMNLDEVVVTGYQTISKERATGSFAKVTSETLDRKRLTNLNTLLEGQVAGFTGGLVRGTTSMSGSTNPLYVIDGFPIENVRYNASTATGGITEGLPELNMEDIESITVLKDAAATSIYGARAANGVVVIITKKAAKGKTRISFSSTLAFSPYSYYTKGLTDAADMIDIEREWAANNKSLQDAAGAATYAQNMLNNNVYQTQGIRAILNYHAGNLTETEMNKKLNALAAQGYSYYNDMEKYAKRNPFQQQYNLSLGKTSDGNMFKASVTYKDNKEEDLYSGDRSLGINLTNNLTVTKWLKLDIGTYNYYQDKQEQSFNVLSQTIYKYTPYDVLKNVDGSPYTSPASERLTKDNYALIDSYGLYSMDITPLDELGMNQAGRKTFQNRTYGRVHIKFADWLNFNSMFQYEYGSERYSKLSDKNSYAVRSKVNNLASRSNNATVFNLPYGNIYNTVDFYSRAYTARQQLDFNKTFGGGHQVTALLGHEVRENKQEFANHTLFNYDPDVLSHTLIDAASLAKSVGAFWGGTFMAYDADVRGERTDRFISMYGNAAYSYDDKYVFTGSLRWDRSNLWGTASKYQDKPVWSTGVAWNMEKEAFMTVSWINRLKLRASYGIGGNVAKNKAPYMVAYYEANPNVGGQQGVITSRPNPELSWEKTTTTNIGVDFALFNNRLGGTLEYYNKYGKDLLASTRGVPTEGYGYSTYQINNGEMQNRGVEITLFGDVIRSKDFTWNATFIYGYNKNKVTYVNIEAPGNTIQFDYPEAYPRIGNPYRSIYAYQWAGLSATGLPQVYNEKGEATSTQPTDLAAVVYAGTTAPVHSGSFGSNFRYKNFDLSFLLVFEAGHKMRNTFLPALGSTYSSAARAYLTNIAATNKNIANRWRTAGDEAHTDIPRIFFAESPDYSGDLYSIYSRADINVIDAARLRLSNISLSYNVPASLCRKALLSGARLQFNIENLVTFAKSEEAKYLLGGYNNPTFVWGLHLNF
ncbi:MAG: SusC/RagA family TonB-linked outer membrane protein [Prevotellaceae bacterium]|jgi:TonB-linked SusC/RagA family outer membrane protein|nr:SusC/RagA family TonB-linked outer membrane protein [Prevotellaceae bacterium]